MLSCIKSLTLFYISIHVFVLCNNTKTLLQLKLFLEFQLLGQLVKYVFKIPL